MLEQQDFKFAGEIPAPRQPGNRYAEYARLLVMFLKLYLQARLLMVQNWMAGIHLQLLELPLIYLKFEVFLVRLSLGHPLSRCWPAEKSLPPINRI
jgi:hypothetical protein